MRKSSISTKNGTGRRAGFTLTEIAVSMIATAVILAGLPFIMDSFVKTGERMESYDYSAVYGLFDDMLYSAAIAKNISISPDSLEIKRYDGCTVRYDYSEDLRRIEKTASCDSGETDERKLVVGRIRRALFSDNGDGTYTVVLNLEGEDDRKKHKLTFKGL